jgi:hypothetical protein
VYSCAGAENTVKLLERLDMQSSAAATVDTIVLHNKRPDVVVSLMMQLIADGNPEVAAGLAAAPARAGRLLSLCEIFNWLALSAHITVAADLIVELARCLLERRSRS